MPVSRSKEKPRTWFRSERVFLSDSEWFFHTREGVDVGPYETHFEAEIEAGLLKELLCERASRGKPSRSNSMAVIREFVLDSFAMGRPLSPNFREGDSQQGS